MTKILAILFCFWLLPYVYLIIVDKLVKRSGDTSCLRLFGIYAICSVGCIVVLVGIVWHCAYDGLKKMTPDRQIALFMGMAIIVMLVVAFCGCSNTAVKTPAVTNNKSLVSETAGVSLSAPMPPKPQALLSKPVVHGCTNCPPNPYINTNWPAYRLSWTASPTPSVSYQVWQASGLKSAFALAGTTTNLFWPVMATNAEGFFKVRSLNQYGLTSGWAT